MISLNKLDWKSILQDSYCLVLGSIWVAPNRVPAKDERYIGMKRKYFKVRELHLDFLVSHKVSNIKCIVAY